MDEEIKTERQKQITYTIKFLIVILGRNKYQHMWQLKYIKQNVYTLQHGSGISVMLHKKHTQRRNI